MLIGECVYSWKRLFGISVSLLLVNKNKQTGTKVPFVLRMHPVSPVVPGRAEVCAAHLQVQTKTSIRPLERGNSSSTCEGGVWDAQRDVCLLRLLLAGIICFAVAENLFGFLGVGGRPGLGRC